MSVRMITGDALAQMRLLPDESVHCCVTSPPYYGLRDYGTAQWDSGDPACGHMRQRSMGAKTLRLDGREHLGAYDGEKATLVGVPFRDVCGHCGARRIDRQIGLEPSPDEYVAALVAVFREVRRVLRSDGTLWLNIGDSYVSNGRYDTAYEAKKQRGGIHVNDADKYATYDPRPAASAMGLKTKDLIGTPWMLAFALRQPYHVGPIKRPEDRAWLAGMLDSDGSLGIRIQQAREGRGTNETYIPYLAISQTDTAALEHCRAITGMGNVNIKRRPPVDPRGIRSKRTYYTWRLDGQLASAVIRDVYPYLLIKKLQAQIIYAMNLSLKWGRPTRSLPVPTVVMSERRRLYECVKALNQRQVIDLPKMAEVPPAEEPGWWLRQDIIWSKPNPMPESVTDRCTKAHEYLFLLSKSERYWFDAAAIAEVQSSAGNGGFSNKATLKSVRLNASHGPSLTDATNDGLRNKRSVWEVATQPFNERVETVRQVRVEADAPADGKKRKASPDCPVHVGQSGSAPKASYGGRAAARSRRNGRSDVDRGPVPPLDYAPIETRHEPATAQQNSGSLDLSCSPSATPHNTENRRTGLALETNPACTASAQTLGRTGGIAEAREPFGSAAHTPENNTSEGDPPAGLSAQIPCHIERITSAGPTRCTCEWYVEIVEKTSHFATFPPALIEPCILAGCPRGGTVLDPFGGAGTTGLVADRLGRDAVLIELNHDYAAMACRRIEDDAPLFAQVFPSAPILETPA